MPRSFNSGNLSFGTIARSVQDADWRDLRVLVQVGIGVLVLMNLVAAAFVFHLFGRSAQETAAELDEMRTTVIQQRNQVARSRQIAAKVQIARGQGDQFLTTYMTPRRTTYSIVVAELQQDCEAAGLTWKEGSIAPLDPVKGSEDLSMMSVSVGVEGTYADLLKFINLLDRSPRFLVIDQLAAAPQPNGKTLSVSLKVNTFVREDNGGSL